ncbi:hypothetical protein [Rhodohalobacter sp. 8-1]|uniref:hypothetical protein n=1 Tax=Rhodohalobacter sp. 8-1 TaxID=3131972 RepID=UPI0030EB5A03
MSIKTSLFYTVFTLHLLVGGFIAFTGILPYRPFYSSIIVLALLPLFSLPINKITKFHLFYSALIIVSSIYNGGGLNSLIVGLRIPIISYTMYLVIDGYFKNSDGDLNSVIKWIALFQLPVVLFQFLFYPTLSGFSSIDIDFLDFRFGTFFVKSDPVMSTFLLLVIILILFAEKKFDKWNIIVLIASSLSIILADSRVSQLALFVVLGFFLIIHSTFKQKIYGLTSILIFFLIFSMAGYATQLQEQLIVIYNQITFQSGINMETFKTGGYSRGAAILYFLSEPLKVIGDGPGVYTNPLVGEMELGLNGEYLKAYAELGILGLLTSITGILVIIFSKLKQTSSSYLIVLIFLLLAITSDIYNDASLMFVFYLMVYIIVNSQKKLPKRLWLKKN